MNTKKITVLGSLNHDDVLQLTRMPADGETTAVKERAFFAGGKGANQAVAAARQGAAVTFIGAVGADDAGERLRQTLVADGIADAYVRTSTTAPTGTAFVMLADSGENTILLHGGANQQVSVADVEAAATSLTTADTVISQFEVPLAAIEAAFRIAHRAGRVTILNPAPALPTIPSSLLVHTTLLVLNETETKQLIGVDATAMTARKELVAGFQALGVDHVVITLGARGSLILTAAAEPVMVPALPAKVRDTTAAGDTFIGTLAAHLRPDLSNLVAAVQYASAASAITVSRLGAIPSIPTAAEVEAYHAAP